ncbi:MAG: spore coat associated protein CotJA [bacterium]|nr:spore coat associated protein CotJA [bacterium]
MIDYFLSVNPGLNNMLDNIQSDNKNFGKTELDNLPLAMAYVPMQKFKGFYSQEEALEKGTLFTDLNKPFMGKFV